MIQANGEYACPKCHFTQPSSTPYCPQCGHPQDQHAEASNASNGSQTVWEAQTELLRYAKLNHLLNKWCLALLATPILFGLVGAIIGVLFAGWFSHAVNGIVPQFPLDE